MVEMTNYDPITMRHWPARAANSEEIAKAFAKELGLIPLRPFE